jgi:acetyl esterase/lipase
MATMPIRPRSFINFTLAMLISGLALFASAQEDPADQNRDGAIELRNDDQQSRWRIPDDATSDNNRMLDRILKRYPESDDDQNGKLDAEEARKFLEEQREKWRQRGNWRRNRIEPTFDDIKYGPADKHHFDLYRAETEDPAPLVIFFHGGQFITGDETSTRPFDIPALLATGISVASIDYRETNEAPFPGPFEDAQMAIQFIRFYAEQLHIDPTRIAGLGDEAGGNLALYLAMHDDLFDQATRKALLDGTIQDPRAELPEGPIHLAESDPDRAKEWQEAKEAKEAEDAKEAEKPKEDQTFDLEQPQKEQDNSVASIDDIVLEELIPWETEATRAASTRLLATVALHPIASFDPRDWKKHKLPMNDHERLMTKYLNVRYLEPLNDPEVIKIVENISPLPLISGGDPPVLLISLYEDIPLPENTVWTIMRHHPRQSELIGSAMRAKGNDAIVRYKGMRRDPDIRSTDFLIKYLK